MTMIFNAAKKDEKITDFIIAQIRDAILSGQLKPGQRLASEKELTAEFQVSKATLRESLRGLETMGLVEIRKGAAGGIYITEVNSQTLMHGMMNFIHFHSVSIREVTMLRYMMEPHIARIAATKLTDEELEELKGFVASEDADRESHRKKNARFHHYLSRITKNSLLILIVDFIDHLLDEIKKELDLQDDFHKMVHDAHKEIIEHLTKRDAEGACRAMADDIVQVGKYMSEKVGEEAFDPERFDPQQTSLVRTALQHENAKVLKDVGSGETYLLIPKEVVTSS